MTQIFTLNDVTKYAYDELEPSKIEGMKSLLETNKEFIQHYMDALEVREMMENMPEQQASQKTLDAIMDFASSESQRFMPH